MQRPRLKLRLRAPSEGALRRFARRHRDDLFSYPYLGGTRGDPPPGYPVSGRRTVLGRGEEVWTAAVNAVRSWRMFELPWVRLLKPDRPPEEGTLCVFASRQLGVWALNACRVVYVVEEHGPLHRVGFAYGTLATHGVQGEERFTVEWDPVDGEVVFDISKFARTDHPLLRLLGPLTRGVQARFDRDAGLAMRRAVEEEWPKTSS